MQEGFSDLPAEAAWDFLGIVAPLSAQKAFGHFLGSKFFLGCKLHKADGFPLLHIEKNSSIIHLDTDAAMYWVTNMGNWAASH
jgi:hypothetical protein